MVSIIKVAFTTVSACENPINPVPPPVSGEGTAHVYQSIGTLSMHIIPTPEAQKINGSTTEMRTKIYLPKDYDEKRSEGYPVLYLLHGANPGSKISEWDSFFPVLDKLISEEVIPPVIAAAPVSGNSYWVNSDKFGAYETAVNVDLISYMDKSYATIKDRTARILSGFSMGGFGALRYGLIYPNLYSTAILLSPYVQETEPPEKSGAVTRGSFGIPFDKKLWREQNYPNSILKYAKQAELVNFYIFATDDDLNHMDEETDLHSDAWKYNMEEQVVRLYTNLHRKNIFENRADGLRSTPAKLRIVSGGHTTVPWLIGFENGLKYAFNQCESNDLSPKAK